jgi:hypothetical protein
VIHRDIESKVFEAQAKHGQIPFWKRRVQFMRMRLLFGG